MKLSIVVIFHNMQREAARTLPSLLAPYQRDVHADDYELIAIDNGSTAPLDADWVTSLGDTIQYHYFETPSPSPAAAMNFGASLAQGDALAVIVDGARMASPRLVANTLCGLSRFDDPLVYALAWHLGHQVQNLSMRTGYNQQTEDALLADINWPTDGYRLFEIAVLAQSSSAGYFADPPPEFSWFAMRKNSFDAIGGFDAGFQAPGGGLINHAFRNRACARAGIQPVCLLGEGVFHQFHGGVATNVLPKDHPMKAFKAEYRQITGRRYQKGTAPAPVFLGSPR